MSMNTLLETYRRDGYAIVTELFSKQELARLIQTIETTRPLSANFRRSSELFAIRQFLQEIPTVKDLIFTQGFRDFIRNHFGEGYFVSKSIYFDKPPLSNWFVAYHQDLTISVDQKVDLDGFGPWTVKQNQFAVQPPLSILQNNFTIRIHLDHTDRYNGALKVVLGSPQKGIYRPETIDWNVEKEAICEVPAGGIMLMSPLLLHASERSTVPQRRKVIHLEFASLPLPEPLLWSEQIRF